jgi:hypothetical protein
MATGEPVICSVGRTRTIDLRVSFPMVEIKGLASLQALEILVAGACNLDERRLRIK